MTLRQAGLLLSLTLLAPAQGNDWLLLTKAAAERAVEEGPGVVFLLLSNGKTGFDQVAEKVFANVHKEMQYNDAAMKMYVSKSEEVHRMYESTTGMHTPVVVVIKDLDGEGVANPTENRVVSLMPSEVDLEDANELGDFVFRSTVGTIERFPGANDKAALKRVNMVTKSLWPKLLVFSGSAAVDGKLAAELRKHEDRLAAVQILVAEDDKSSQGWFDSVLGVANDATKEEAKRTVKDGGAVIRFVDALQGPVGNQVMLSTADAIRNLADWLKTVQPRPAFDLVDQSDPMEKARLKKKAAKEAEKKAGAKKQKKATKKSKKKKLKPATPDGAAKEEL